MAQNFISNGQVITLKAKAIHASGKPYRISGFNGVALISVEKGEQLSFQPEGVFEFTMPDIEIGNLIYIDPDDNLTLDHGGFTAVTALPQEDIGRRTVFPVYGRAITATVQGKFHCLLLQS